MCLLGVIEEKGRERGERKVTRGWETFVNMVCVCVCMGEERERRVLGIERLLSVVTCIGSLNACTPVPPPPHAH